MLQFDAIPQPVSALLDRLAQPLAHHGFALGGGTALALRFGHRLSVDLDFFTERPFDPDGFFDLLPLGGATVVRMAENTLSLDADGVKVDLLRHAYGMLEPPEQIDGVLLLSLPDNAAMKFNAIANRGSKKDFFDASELLSHFSLQELLGFYCDKYENVDPFTVIRSLAWFEDAESEPDPISLGGRDWPQVKADCIQAVSRL